MAEFRQDPSMGESTTSKPTGATAPTLVTSPTGLPLCRSSVLAAHELIKPHIHRTPVLTSRTLDKLASLDHEVEGYIKFNLFFKAECFQKIGAFKYRGARHALERLLAGGDGGGGASGVNGRRSPAETLREKGVVTHSSGNHAQVCFPVDFPLAIAHLLTIS